jgi:hypothetical protein
MNVLTLVMCARVLILLVRNLCFARFLLSKMFVLDECSPVTLFPYYTSILFCVVIKLLVLCEGENRNNFDEANLPHNSTQP